MCVDDDSPPDNNEPDADEPDADEPDADEPDVDEPDVDEPDADEPDADEPDADEPDADEPDADPSCDGDDGCGEGEICEEGLCTPGCRADDGCAEGEFCDQASFSCVDGCRVGACGEGEVCDLDTRQCVEVPCGDDTECDQGQICVEGRCAPGCRGDEGCADGQICVEDACVEGCRQDSGCVNGQICVEDVCVEGCRDDTACDGGQICLNDVCVEGCRGDEGCADGQICVEDACVEGCRQDEACVLGQICEGDLCVDGCRSDANCPGSLVCVEGACIEGCRDDADCPGGFECLQAQCEPVRCARDQDCSPGTFCDVNEAVCVPGCRADQECGPGQLCDDLSRVCVEGCRGDDDCAFDQYCDGVCTDGCRLTPGSCLDFEFCDEGTRTCARLPCQGDVDCAPNEFCRINDNSCVEGCRGNESCPDGQFCALDARQCVEGCRQDGECPGGEYCDIPDGDSFGQCAVGCRQRLCFVGEACNLETRQCEEAQQCANDEECGGEQICFQLLCVDGCRLDADCPDGQLCDGETLTCRFGCDADAACNSSEYCDEDERRCITGCRQDADCLEGQSCESVLDERINAVRQQCRPTPCDVDGECPDAFYCGGDGQCAPGCRQGQCPPGDFCEQDTRECVPQPCQDDDGCPQGRFCDLERGVCAEGCQSDADCELNTICEVEARTCVPGCRSDQGCSDAFYCDFPRGQDLGLCEAGCRVGDCGEGQACDTVARRCRVIGCRGDEDCLEDEYCRDNVECEPGCRGDQECGEGLICVDDLRFCGAGCRQAPDSDDLCAEVEPLLLAFDVPEVISGQRVCLGEVDHFAVALEAGDRLRASLEPGDGFGALKMDLYGPGCDAVVAESVFEEGETIFFSAPTSGVYTVRVRGLGRLDSNDYELRLERLPAECRREPTEPNDTAQDATAIRLPRGFRFEDNNLTACDGDQDWFAVEVEEPGDAIQATVIQDALDVPLRVEIRFTNGLTVLESNEEPVAAKSVQTGALTTPGTYFIRVTPTAPVPDGAGVSYAFQTVVSEAGACVEDGFEPNETPVQSTLLNDGIVTPSLCQDRRDEDWYRVVLLPFDFFNLALTYDHDRVDPDPLLAVTLYGPGGVNDLRDFTSQDGNSDTDTLTFEPDGFIVTEELAGEWLIHVQTGAGAGALDYALDVTVDTPICDADDEVVPNDSCAEATRLQPGEEVNGFICGPAGDEDWFVIEDIAGQNLGVFLEHFHFDGNLELEVYDSQTDELLGFSNNAGPNFEFVAVPGLHAGDACIRVFARSVDVQNRYTIGADFD